MNQNKSIKANDKTSLTEQTKFQLCEIIRDFYQEINQRKSTLKLFTLFYYIKKLNKYVTAFDYIATV